MRESRTQESEKFERFFAFVRKEAEKIGAVFFIDCGEGREHVTDKMEMEDLSGWLIPMEKVNDFEKEFYDNEVSGKWNSFVRFAIWSMNGDQLRIEFQS